MFSIAQKRAIAEIVQRVLRSTNHPELPKGEIQFALHVDGTEPWSYARIRNNGATPNPDVNPHNEAQPGNLPTCLHIRLERDDSIPAFGAFLRCEPPCDENPVILLNVDALMSPALVDGDGSPVPMDNEERKRNIITTLMHEFGHALEEHFGVPVNEGAIEAACQKWDELHEWRQRQGGGR
ncbi:MAG: hypothetical protein KIT22_10115 [Verrucomicrobiae bacterium]|nr:hypothetical protein [Verrucomicrobiae bacterium]